nr:segmentation polarity homeobox protein engrailed-like [Ipomoea batatas]
MQQSKGGSRTRKPGVARSKDLGFKEDVQGQQGTWPSPVAAEDESRPVIEPLVLEEEGTSGLQSGRQNAPKGDPPAQEGSGKRYAKIKELELQVVAVNLRVENVERLLTDPLLLADHACKELMSVEVFLSALPKTPVGEDLLCTYGTWAFNAGRKAMQVEVWAALEVVVDENDLPKVLGCYRKRFLTPGQLPSPMRLQGKPYDHVRELGLIVPSKKY